MNAFSSYNPIIFLQSANFFFSRSDTFFLHSDTFFLYRPCGFELSVRFLGKFPKSLLPKIEVPFDF